MQYFVTGYKKVAVNVSVDADTPKEALRIGRELIWTGQASLAGEETYLNDFDVDAADGEPLLIVIDGNIIN
jgi:hypothetical protein